MYAARLGVARDQQGEAERDQRHAGGEPEDRAGRDQPEVAQQEWQEDRRDVVDGEGHGGGGAMSPGSAIFWK